MSPADVFQLVLTMVAVVSLLATVVYNARSLKASRQQSVATAYLALNQRVQEILYAILDRDNDALKQTELDGDQKFRFYQLLDVFADMHQLLPMLREHDPALAEISLKRVTRLIGKPAVKAAWRRQLTKNSEIFTAEFVVFMNADPAPQVGAAATA